MIINILSILLTMLIAVIGILMEATFLVKVLLIVLLLLSAITSIILIYRSDKEANFIKNSLSNLVRAIQPPEFVRENITHLINDASSQRGYPTFCVTEYDNIHIYNFTNEKGERVGYLVLKKEDILDLSLFWGKDLANKISAMMFGKWGKDDLNKDWHLITKNIFKIAHSIFSKNFDTDGLRSNLDFDNKTISLYPIDKDGMKISRKEVVLKKEYLNFILSLPPIERGKELANRCEALR